MSKELHAEALSELKDILEQEEQQEPTGYEHRGV